MGTTRIMGAFLMGDLSVNFSRSEFACRCGCGYDTVDAKLLEALEALRQHFGSPVSISSGCRCREHNQIVGGSSRSQHLFGRAADIVVRDVGPDEVADYLERTFTGRLGVGRYTRFTHVDSRGNAARWDYRS